MMTQYVVFYLVGEGNTPEIFEHKDLNVCMALFRELQANPETEFVELSIETKTVMHFIDRSLIAMEYEDKI